MMAHCTKKPPYKTMQQPIPTAQEQLMYYAHLAPSAHNTKPWLFKTTDNQIDLLIDFSKQLPVADPDNRELYISVGCALTNLLVAAQHYGFKTQTSYPLCNNLIATVTLIKTDTSAAPAEQLFAAITQRHTVRSRYSNKLIPEPIIKQLHACCIGDVKLILVSGTVKNQIAQLVYDGDRLQYANRAYTDELAHWIKHGLIYSGFSRACASFAVQHLPLGRFIAAQDKKLITSAPLLGILCAPNTPLSWVHLGESYERIALTATANGIKTHPMNQGLTEVPAQQKKLKKLLNTPQEPLFCFRIGY